VKTPNPKHQIPRQSPRELPLELGIWSLGFERPPSDVLRCPSDHARFHLLLSPRCSGIEVSMLLYEAGDWPVRGRETHTDLQIP
jgi:hypothetical protein